MPRRAGGGRCPRGDGDFLEEKCPGGDAQGGCPRALCGVFGTPFFILTGNSRQLDSGLGRSTWDFLLEYSSVATPPESYGSLIFKQVYLWDLFKLRPGWFKTGLD